MIRSASPSVVNISYPPAPSSPFSTPADEHEHEQDPDPDASSTDPSPPRDEHCFLIGADPSAIPFFPSPRIVMANGPPPTRDDLDWSDEETYQALLNRTTVRCVNVLGQTALRDADDEGAGAGVRSEFTLRLLEMHDENLPSGAQGPIGRGYQCCLMKDSSPLKCLAVYHVNPYYSTDLLYRVKAASYKSDEPLVAEAPEHIILALVGRQMALASCLVGVITNGHLLIVVEAGATNSAQASSLRTHTQAFIDCNATEATDGARRSLEGAYDPLAAKIAKLELLEGRAEGAGAPAAWAREREAATLGFERADMMFIWYAVMLHAYEKHVEFIFCAFRIFQLWADYGGHAVSLEPPPAPALPTASSYGARPDLSDLPAMPISPTETLPLYAEEDMEMKRIDTKGKSSSRSTDDDEDQYEAVRQGVAFQRVSARISAPAPACLRPFSASASTRATQGAAQQPFYLSPTPTSMPTPGREDLAGRSPLSPAGTGTGTGGRGGGARVGSGSGSAWGLSSAWLRNSTYTLPGSSWFRGGGGTNANAGPNASASADTRANVNINAPGSAPRDAATAAYPPPAHSPAGWMQYSPPNSPCLSDGGERMSESAYLLPDDAREGQREDGAGTSVSASTSGNESKVRAVASGTAAAADGRHGEEVTLVQERERSDVEVVQDEEEEIRFEMDEDKTRLSGRVGSQRMGWI